MPWTTFTDPEVAHVGQTEEEARRAHGRVLVLRAPFAHVDRAQAEGRTEGFVKRLVTPWRGQIRGAHIVGPQAGELIQEVGLAMRRRDKGGRVNVPPRPRWRWPASPPPGPSG